MFSYNPRGNNLRALEKNILKYRTFEIIVILFYIEEIKSIALNAIKFSDKLKGHERLPAGAKKIYKKLWDILVTENILTEHEKSDIEAIIEYRNNIAHSIETMVYDLNLDPYSKDAVQAFGVKYKYGIVNRLQSYKKIIYERCRGKYILQIDTNSILFAQAEKTYLKELEKLDKKILRQLKERECENERVMSEISRIGMDTINALAPYHPDNFKSNGSLSTRGVDCLNKLFNMECSNIVISYLMRKPIKTINRLHKVWFYKKTQ